MSYSSKSSEKPRNSQSDEEEWYAQGEEVFALNASGHPQPTSQATITNDVTTEATSTGSTSSTGHEEKKHGKDEKDNDSESDEEDSEDDEDEVLFDEILKNFSNKGGDKTRRKLLEDLKDDLGSGNCCTRWKLFTKQQKGLVLERVCNLTKGQLTIEALKADEDASIVFQGSYVFGCANKVPGDIDIIVATDDKKLKGTLKNIPIESVIGSTEARPVTNDKVKVGTEMSVADQICCIVLNSSAISIVPVEGEDDDDEEGDPRDEADACFESIRSGLVSLVNVGVAKDLADRNNDKAARKIVNIATLILYVIDAIRELGQDDIFEDEYSKSKAIVIEGNKKLVSGSFDSMPDNFIDLYRKALGIWKKLDVKRTEILDEQAEK